jgi:transposase
MKFVATKTADQFDLQALHRVVERRVSQHTGITNQIRAVLLERGIAVRQGLLTRRRSSVLWMPPGARSFACRQTSGRQVGYGSRFLARRQPSAQR